MAKTNNVRLKEEFNISQSALWFIILPLLLTAFITLMLVLQIRFLLNNSRMVTKSQHVVSEINFVEKLAVDMETGVRGYELTKKGTYLEPYLISIKVINENLIKLEDLVKENSYQSRKLKSIHELMNLYTAYSEKSIKRLKTNHLYSSIGDLNSHILEGKRTMDSIRQNLFDVLKEEENISQERLRQAEINTGISIGLIIFLSLVLSGALSLSLFKRIKILANKYNEILQEVLTAHDNLESLNLNLEKRIEDRTSELSASNLELEAFSYSVSHDLRAPLRGIDGFSQAILEDYGDKLDEQGKVYLNYIRQGVQKMGHLIDDLLNLSRITRYEIKKTDVDLTALFEDAKKDLDQLAHRPHMQKNTFEVEPNLKAYGDEGMLRVILDNLMSNAWKFTRDQKHPKITLGLKKLGEKNVYFLKDNGVGFDMRFKDKLFNAFQRLHSSSDYAGTGIGLATVKRIILKHSGEIWVESKIGEGTTFFFTLPEKEQDL